MQSSLGLGSLKRVDSGRVWANYKENVTYIRSVVYNSVIDEGLFGEAPMIKARLTFSQPKSKKKVTTLMKRRKTGSDSLV